MRDSASRSTKSHPRRDRAPETFAATSNRPPAAPVLLFDIDGTLVLTGGAGARAMSRAFEELFGVPQAFAAVPFAGRTDAWLLDAALQLHGIEAGPAETARFHEIYIRYLSGELDRPAPRKGVMPGVQPLLDSLAGRDDVYMALLTGNTERGARLKLEYFDLWRFFPCGAFGGACRERNALLPAALSQVEACGGPVVQPSQVVVVGDTPLDVACAAAGGARSIAVATGSHSAGELKAAGADVVFETLSDTSAVLAEIDRLTR